MKDRGFCSPIIDEAGVAAKKKKEALDREIEMIKQEYEEKRKQKQNKEAQKRDKTTGKPTEKDKNSKISYEGNDELEKGKNSKVYILKSSSSIEKRVDS